MKRFLSTISTFVTRRSTATRRNARGERRRRLSIETCEARRLLASDLHQAFAEGESPAFPIAADKMIVYQQQDVQGKQTLIAFDPAHPGSAATVPLTSLPPDAQAGSPEWSPNGNWLLFTNHNTQLFVLNAFDGRILPVVDAHDSPVAGFFPQWVGDRRISFSTFAVYENSVSNLDIFVGDIRIDADSAILLQSVNLTYNPGADFRHDWSLDGSQLVFESSRSGAGDLYVMNLQNFDGSNLPSPVNLTSGRQTANDSDPQFSPSGSQIAFRSSTGNSDIWVMNSDGTSIQRLTIDPADEESPTWSPDGSQLAYSARTFTSGTFSENLRIMNADGSNQQELTTDAGSQSLPTWRKNTPPPSDLSIQMTMPESTVEDLNFNIEIEVHNRGVVDAENATIVVAIDPRIALDQIADGKRVDDHVEFEFPIIAVGQTIHRILSARAFHSGKQMRAEVGVTLAADNDPELSNNETVALIDATPRNDNFAKATSISVAGSLPIANFNATKETSVLGVSEPEHGFDAHGVANAGGSSIWYQWRAFNNGQATFSTKGSRFDTIMSAYFVTGNNLLQRVASNDDTDGTSSRITFNTLAEETYYIAIDGFNGAQGAGYLNWSATANVVVNLPQYVFDTTPSHILAGSPATQISLTGFGFSSNSQVYVLGADESQQAPRFASRNFLQTIFRSTSQLDVEVPLRFFSIPGALKLVVVRGNELSNFTTFQVTPTETMPIGFSINLGRISLIGDMISRLPRIVIPGSGEGEDETERYSVQGHVAFNNYLAVEGASIEVQVNRNTNVMQVRIRQGRIQLTNVPRYNTITLWSGNDFEFKLDGDGELTGLLRAVVETPLRDKGIDVSVSRAHLLLGTTNDSQGRPIYGVEIFGSLKFLQIPGLINIPLNFDKLVLTQNDGMRFSGEIGPLSFDVGGLVKLEEVFLRFEAGRTPQEDGFSGRAKISTALLSASGSVELQNGLIKSVSGGLDIPGITGLPLGPLNITGGSLGLQNLLNPENLQVRIGASATIAHPAVSNVLKLADIGVFYRLPAALGGDGSLQIFKVPAASAEVDLDFSKRRFTFGGEVELLTSFPLFLVRGELTASVSPAGFKVNGFAEGIVQIPDGNGGLYDVLKACGNFFGLRVGPCLDFPMVIASAKLSYLNSQFSFSTSLPIIGSTALRVKQVAGAVQATVDLFHNIPNVPTHFVFGGGGGEGEFPADTIGTLIMPAGSPRMIVSVAKQGALPLYDLIDPLGNRYTPDDIAFVGGTFFQNSETGDSVYVVENPMPGEWTAVAHIGVTGPLEFEAWGANAAPELTNVEVQPLGDEYQIYFQAFDADDDPRVSLYYTTSPENTDGTLIAEGLLASQTQSFIWNAADGSVPTGTYYIYAVAEDDLNTPAFRFASTPVTVVDPFAPSQPFITQLSAVENAIDVQWDSAIADDLDGYQVWYGVDEGSDTIWTAHMDAGLANSLRLKGLESNKTYAVTVIAYSQSIEDDPLNPGTTLPRYRFSLPAITQMTTTGEALPPTVTLSAPSQGAKLAAGSMLQLEWTVQEESGLQRQQLFISDDDGATYSILAQYGADVRSANWPIPADIPLSNLRFRIVVQDVAGNSASADSLGFQTLPAGTIAFDTASIQINENAGHASVKVRRTGGNIGSVSVHYITSASSDAGSGQADVDYRHVSNDLTFADGESEMTLTIPIFDDLQVEGSEMFNLTLRSSTGGSQLGETVLATITILNDDVVRDTDGDGLDDAIESQSPNNGDGNLDGVPDSTQANVASYFDADSGKVLTFSLPIDRAFQNIRLLSGAAAPDFVGAISGGLSLDITGAVVGETVTIGLQVFGTAVDTILLYAPTIKDSFAHWYYFTNNGATGSSYISDQQATIKIKDGGRGDADAQPNSRIQLNLSVGSSTHVPKYQNQLKSLDVNGDEFVTAIDALFIINELNTVGSRRLIVPPLPFPNNFAFLDTSGDFFVSAIDVLLIINQLNTQPGGEGEVLPITQAIACMSDRDAENVELLVDNVFSHFEWDQDIKRIRSSFSGRHALR